MKTCIRCHEDCSNRPRVRDPEGRYICRSCLDAAVADKHRQPARSAAGAEAPSTPKPQRKPQPKPRVTTTPAPAPRGGVLAGQVDDFAPLVDDVDTDFLSSCLDTDTAAAPDASVSVPAGRVCMACSEPLFGDAVVCLRCGYNSETGRTMKTRKAKAVKEKRTASERHPLAPILTFVITSALYIGLTMYRWDEPQAIGLAALGFIVVSALVYITVIVSAFLDSVVQGLLSFLFTPYMIYWVFFRSGNGWLMSLFGISVVVWGCLVARVAMLVATGGPEG